MRKFVLFFLIACMLFSLFSCSSASRNKKFTEYYFDWFDTVTIITGYAESREEFDKVTDEAEAIFDNFHKLFDIYNKYDGMNNLAVLNEIAKGADNAVEVDADIIDLLQFSKNMYQFTDGKFNPAMGALLSVWHDYRERGLDDSNNAELPPSDMLYDAYSHSDITDIIIDNDNNTVYLADEYMKLDVGAIAKGYACEQAAKHLESMGISGYLINSGGNIRSVGKKNDGSGWIVGIENPNADDKKNPYIAYVELNGQALVTSGGYHRFYIVNDKKYHHIIDPETLMPSARYLSVSVLSPDSGVCDALSTALFNMPYEDGINVIRKFSNTEALWILPDGEILYSEGFKQCLLEKGDLN